MSGSLRRAPTCKLTSLSLLAGRCKASSTTTVTSRTTRLRKRARLCATSARRTTASPKSCVALNTRRARILADPFTQEEESCRTKDKFDTVKKDEQQRRETIIKLEREVTALEIRVADAPERPDLRPIDADLVRCSLGIL